MKSKNETIRLSILAFAILVIVSLIYKWVGDASAATDNITAYAPPTLDVKKSTDTLPLDSVSICDEAYPDRLEMPPGSEKREIEERDYAGCVAARNSPMPGPNAKPVPTIIEEPNVKANNPQRVAGDGVIIEDNITPLPGTAYVIINNWSKVASDKKIVVYAGARRDNPNGPKSAAQGIVKVMVWTTDYQYLGEEGGVYPTPIQAGPVRIVDANGMQLTLVAENGTGFFFDVAARKFVFPGPQGNVSRTAGKGVITETRTPLFSLGDYVFENQWSEELGDKRITVWAGVESQDIEQGIVAVVVTSSGEAGALLSTYIYQTPVKSGSVRIFDAQEEQITLASLDGSKYVFDVPTRLFTVWPEIPPDTPPSK